MDIPVPNKKKPQNLKKNLGDKKNLNNLNKVKGQMNLNEFGKIIKNLESNLKNRIQIVIKQKEKEVKNTLLDNLETIIYILLVIILFCVMIPLGIYLNLILTIFQFNIWILITLLTLVMTIMFLFTSFSYLVKDNIVEIFRKNLSKQIREDFESENKKISSNLIFLKKSELSVNQKIKQIDEIYFYDNEYKNVKFPTINNESKVYSSNNKKDLQIKNPSKNYIVENDGKLLKFVRIDNTIFKNYSFHKIDKRKMNNILKKLIFKFILMWSLLVSFVLLKRYLFKPITPSTLSKKMNKLENKINKILDIHGIEYEKSNKKNIEKIIETNFQNDKEYSLNIKKDQNKKSNLISFSMVKN